MRSYIKREKAGKMEKEIKKRYIPVINGHATVNSNRYARYWCTCCYTKSYLRKEYWGRNRLEWSVQIFVQIGIELSKLGWKR